METKVLAIKNIEGKYASIIESPIGKITILADDNYVNAVAFEEQLIMDIDELTENEISKNAAQQLQQYFDGALQDFSLPLQQDGTDFQQEVWGNLLHIPYAKTVSYSQFSAHKPLAIRAIASANGKNKLNIIVPCHRVIGANGKLVGYGGGLWRKKWLIDHEKNIAKTGQTEFNF